MIWILKLLEQEEITSLQMDINFGITFEIMEQTLSQLKMGDHILEKWAFSASRSDVGKHTPKMEKINVDKKNAPLLEKVVQQLGNC